MSETRVMVAAERTLFRQGLAALIDGYADFVVVGEGASADEARRITLHERPDIIVLDSALLRAEGACDLVMCLRADCPHAGIVVIGEADLAAESEEEAEIALREERSQVLQKGALAYIPARVDQSELLRTLSHVTATLRDEQSPAAAHAHDAGIGNGSPRHKITERERAVIAMVAQGMCNKEVAHRLGISTQTVKNHVSHLLDKLALADRTQLAVYAVEHHFEF
jgi:DNA-binding NarL/FixJ family response regulator